ncbi:MAG TPA: thioredoxin domain-containing protein [Anaerolineae bacterium]|nr:thioredoxin domain-containing protein [Anaerolineae bacterium]
MPNQLIHETSPYLRQHADNPVVWYPWGEEALQKAQTEDKPILLSIGYAACHWCHVMAHESFEDPATAVYMNEHFVNIKVDREERPDLDQIYMQAVVAMTGQGGWPMTVFLTPDGRPFYGGTYYPPAPRHGMPSFMQVMEAVSDAWQKRRKSIDEQAGKLSAHLQRTIPLGQVGGTLEKEVLRQAAAVLFNNFDQAEGGFGGAPKFPPSMTLEFLLRHYLQSGEAMALYMVEHTLEKMADGGIYDQIGGGFARYATDAHWLVPHFEKMLYDNALLTRVYLHAFQVTGKPLYRRIVEETLDFVVRELRHPAGGFYSSYDADSEGVEGKFYVWSAAEIQEILGEDAPILMAYYGVTEQGNWEGYNILHLPRSPQETAVSLNIPLAELEAKMSGLRQQLYDVRAQRVWPGLDDKVLTSWNGLMLAAFAEAGRALNRPDYTEIARQNAAFLQETMGWGDGRLYHTWKDGAAARHNGYLEDYAYLADGLLALYQTTFEPRWFVWARQLADTMLAHFHDEADGGFFDTADDHESLLYRPKELQDNATPGGNSMAAGVLLRLALYTGEMAYWDVAETAVAALKEPLLQHPSAFAQWLTDAAFILSEPQEVAIIGEPEAADTAALLDVVFARYQPNLVVAVGLDGESVPLLDGRTQLNNEATAYVCRRFICHQPVTQPQELTAQLDG